jgi:hypothetical protein
MPTPLHDVPDEASGLVIAHWNKIYLCYCFSRGEGDPLRMVIRDAALEPDDFMRGFLTWLPHQWARFMDIVEPHWRGWDHDDRQLWRRHRQDAFTSWLWAEWAKPEPRPGPASEPEKESS